MGFITNLIERIWTKQPKSTRVFVFYLDDAPKPWAKIKFGNKVQSRPFSVLRANIWYLKGVFGAFYCKQSVDHRESKVDAINFHVSEKLKAN